MEIIDFKTEHIPEALALAKANYDGERIHVNALPESVKLPPLDCFAENGLGVAAIERSRLIGYLCCYTPWDNAFGTAARGTFSPIHAHGAITDGRVGLYRRMYQAAAQKWVNSGVTYHAIALYAHDREATEALFTYGFGMRCVDAIASLDSINVAAKSGLTYRKLGRSEVGLVREMRGLLSAHLSQSPCFMYSSPEDYQSWLNRAETRDSDLYAAFDGDSAIAFVEITDEGENFVTDDDGMRNICGAFCMPDYRGNGVYASLLGYVSGELIRGGYTLLGVDYESFNPTAFGFWNKYFTTYTHSVTRRIDEGVLNSERRMG